MTGITSAVPGLPLQDDVPASSAGVERLRLTLSTPQLAGLLFILIGLAFVAFGLEYRLGTPRNMGPGMFPVAGGALLLLFGIGTFIAGRRSTDRLSPVALRPLVATLGSVLLFSFLVERVGLAIAAPVLIGGVVLATGQGSWKTALGLGIPLTIVAIVAFPILLGVPLKVLP